MKLIISAILFFSTTIAWSHDHHDTRVIQQESSPGTALAIATSQIHPELGTSKLQLGFGLGFHNDNTAAAIGLHQRIKLGNGNALFGGTLSSGNSGTAIGVGLNTKF